MIVPGRTALLILIASTLVGCQPALPTPHSTPSATTQPAAESQSTPTATLAAFIQQPDLLPDSDGQLWAVGSLRNDSEQPVQGLEFQLNFLDADGQPLASAHTTPVPSVLAAGAQAHFTSRFEGEGQPVSVRAQLASYLPSAQEPETPELRLEAILPRDDGGSRVIGFLTHQGQGVLNLVGFSLVAQQTDELIALPNAQVLPQQLPSGSQVPWQAEFGQDLSSDQLQVFTSGLPAINQTGCQLEIDLEPGLQFDPQGKPFFSGLLRNRSNSPCQVRLLNLVKANRKVLELIPLESAIPLAPGEVRPFGFRFQPITDKPRQADYTVDPFLETTSQPEADLISLDLQVTSFEILGSNLFVQGVATNVSERTALLASLFAAVRSTDGQLLTAGWLALPAEINPGASPEFVLSLPISEAMDIGTAEFDLRALGVLAENVE